MATKANHIENISGSVPCLKEVQGRLFSKEKMDVMVPP